MADKIIITELDINATDVFKKITELKAGIKELSDTQKALKSSSKDNTEEYARNEAQLKVLNSQLNVNRQIAADVIRANDAQSNSIDNLNNLLSREINTKNDAKNQNKELIILRDSLNAKTKEGSDAIQELNKKINDNNNFIKENSSALEQQKLNIGDYKNQIISAFQDIKNGNIANGFKGLSVAIGGVVKSMVSFVANPIGAVITTIGLVLLPVINYFKTFQPLLDKIDQAMGALGNAFQSVGGIIVDFFSNIKSVGDFLNKIGDIISHPIDSFDKLGKTVSDAAKRGNELVKQMQDLEDTEKIIALSTSKLEAEYNRLIVASKNRTLSEKERISFLRQAAKIDEEIFNQQKSLADKQSKASLDAIANDLKLSGFKEDQAKKEISLIKEKGLQYLYDLQDRSKITDKTIELFQKSEQAKIDVLALSTKREEQRNNRLDQLADQQEQKRQKRLEQQKKDDENIANLIIETQKEVADAKKKDAEDAIKVANNELNNYIAAHKSKLDNDKFLSQESFNIEIDRLSDISKRREDFEKNKYEKGLISEQEYQTNIQAIQIEFDNQKDELAKQRDEAEIIRKTNNAQLDLEIQELSNQNEYELQLAQLDRQYQADIANAEKTGADKTLILKKYSLQQQKIEEARTLATAQAYATMFGQIKELVGQNTILGKSAAIAETTIQTYVAATNAYAAAAKIDPIFLAPTMAGLAIAAGLANVAKITEVDTEISKAEKGMLLTGKSHANGGIPAIVGGSNIVELEGGEAVINKKSTAMFLPQLSAMNQAGGGVKFANGGIAIPYSNISSNTIIKESLYNYDVIKNIVNRINDTKVVAIVDDINTGIYNRVQILDKSRI